MNRREQGSESPLVSSFVHRHLDIQSQNHPQREATFLAQKGGWEREEHHRFASAHSPLPLPAQRNSPGELCKKLGATSHLLSSLLRRGGEAARDSEGEPAARAAVLIGGAGQWAQQWGQDSWTFPAWPFSQEPEAGTCSPERVQA